MVVLQPGLARTNQVRSDNADATLATIYDAWVTLMENLARA